jgi:Arc/MetJ-type ribon-helix-helix transcriptional regulator
MGLKDLRKPASADTSLSEKEKEERIRDFVEGAPMVSAKKRGPSKKTLARLAYKRVTFSLSQNVEDEITKLSRIPRGFSINKSQVVRAGILALLAMDRATLLPLLERAAKGDTTLSSLETDTKLEQTE